MIPHKYDLTFYRGATFDLELVAQVKTYAFNPATNNTIGDLKRTHQENLDHYGFSYVYLNFATVYESVSLRVIKPWVKAGGKATTPLLELSDANDALTLTSKSVKILLDASSSKALEFDSGMYELLLTKADGTIDVLVYGSVTVLGDKQ